MLKKNTQVVLIVFLVLLLVSWAIQYYADQNLPEESGQFPGQAETFSTPLFSFSPTQVQSFSIRDLDGNAVSMARTETGWWLSQPATPEEFTDQTRVEGTIGQLAVVQTIDTGGDINASLGVIGLEFPPYRVEIVLLDGTVYELRIGNSNPSGTGYYVQLNTNRPVLIQKAAIDQWISLIDFPPAIATPEPEPTPESPDA